MTYLSRGGKTLINIADGLSLTLTEGQSRGFSVRTARPSVAEAHTDTVQTIRTLWVVDGTSISAIVAQFRMKAFA